MNLPKFLLSGFSTITILLIGSPIAIMYQALRQEKATGLEAVAGGITVAIFTPQFWLAAILLLLFFWYTSQAANQILRVVLFWIPAISSTVVGGAIFTIVGYLYLCRSR